MIFLNFFAYSSLLLGFLSPMERDSFMARTRLLKLHKLCSVNLSKARVELALFFIILSLSYLMIFIMIVCTINNIHNIIG